MEFNQTNQNQGDVNNPAPAKWITKWSELDKDQRYLVVSLANYGGELVPQWGRATIDRGWQVERLMEKTYIALPLPGWDGKLD